MLKEHTKDIHPTIDLLNYGSGPESTVTNIVKALATLPKLQHLDVTLTGTPLVAQSSMAGNNPDLFQFFDLDLDTFTFIWAREYGSGYDLKRPYSDTLDPNYTRIPSLAEYQMQQTRNSFMENTYKTSSWYSEVDGEDGSILPGRTITSHDWYGKKLNGIYMDGKKFGINREEGIVQWEMDTFHFKVGCVECPHWSLEVSPYNHPSQLSDGEKAAQCPLLNWKKCFE